MKVSKDQNNFPLTLIVWKRGIKKRIKKKSSAEVIQVWNENTVSKLFIYLVISTFKWTLCKWENCIDGFERPEHLTSSLKTTSKDHHD